MTVTLLTLALSFPAAPAPVPKLERPQGPAPRVAMITAAHDGKFQLVDTKQVLVQRQVQVNVQVGQQVRQVAQIVTVSVPVAEHRTLNVEDVRFYGLDGKKIEGEDAAKLMTKDMPALVSSDGKPVDRFYLRVAVKGTLVLVLPPSLEDEPALPGGVAMPAPAVPAGVILPAAPPKKIPVERKK